VNRLYSQKNCGAVRTVDLPGPPAQQNRHDRSFRADGRSWIGCSRKSTLGSLPASLLAGRDLCHQKLGKFKLPTLAHRGRGARKGNPVGLKAAATQARKRKKKREIRRFLSE
jgi:hypothetical protein